MSIAELNSILIVEPNQALTYPYCHFPLHVTVKRTTTLDHALRALIKLVPNMVCISTSLPPAIILRLLEAVKEMSHTRLIPVLFVVDLNASTSTIIGTSWGSKLGMCSTNSSAIEVYAELERMTNQP